MIAIETPRTPETIAALLAARVLQFAGLGFDVAIEEILPTLAAGGAVVLGETDAAPTFQEREDLCAAEGISVLNLPATYGHEWVSSLTARSRPAASSSSIRRAGSRRPARSARSRSKAPASRSATGPTRR